MPNSLPIEIFILAGGRSSRMGRDKARVLLRGHSMLSHVKARLNSLGAPIRVIRKDILPGLGPIGGIHTALNRSHQRQILVLACDNPLIHPRTIRYVMRGIRRQDRGVVTLTPAGPGFPILLRRTAKPLIAQLIQDGRRAVHHLASMPSIRLCRPPRRWSLDLLNVNTPGDLHRAQHLIDSL